MPISKPIVMDIHQRDRFELLSAYLDGEVTATERRQIEDWLTSEPQVQSLYARALKLRQEWQMMAIPLAQHPVERIVGQMSLHNRKKRPKMAGVWGASVLAAVVISALLGVLPERQSPVPTMAQAPQLMVKPGH
jgi:anti-sigma factor RsiW